MRYYSKLFDLASTSPITIVSLLLFALTTITLGQVESENRRVKSSHFPLSATAPKDWEVFTEPGEDPAEVLFFQKKQDGEVTSLLSLTVHPVTGAWDDIIRRQNHHLLVWEGVPLQTNQALKLRGSQGHKWVFTTDEPDGSRRLHYRFYLLLPANVGPRRLLLLEGVAPEADSLEMVPLFNAVARSLNWGLEAESPLPAAADSEATEES